jgi:tetratricopeptide (TPR) repeat protein
MYSRAEQQFRKTIELNPGFSQAHFSLSQYYAFNNGRMDLGVEKSLDALRLDPGAPFTRTLLVMYLTELGDIQNAEMFRQSIADLSTELWVLGWADMMIANAKGSAGGIAEAFNWMRPRMPPIPFITEFSSLLFLANDNPEGARDIIVESSPGWMEPEKWGLLIDSNPTSACMVAWTLVQTGDTKLGQALLKQSLAYIEEMPAFVEHPDSWNIEACYLLAGDNEKALEIIESQLVHNHLFWWKTIHKLSMFEAVRHEPRYQAVRAEVGRRLNEQREAVSQMNLETGP